ncbi:unnamed protein product [Adineta steineri]|uniref:Uncharacterized protein n=1 Tax=Adineta steineri TaxID=433720 RepID=A0A814H4L2_9BILA|nr:unnamed protein product [Adineta steineri]CAF1230231.1 unnamed protein product [Adineta steineri]CAF1302185.1 unnamed protein product [Adineta steineri]
MYHTVRIRDLAPQSLTTDSNPQHTGHKQANSTVSEQYWAKSIDQSSYGDKYRQTFFKANGSHTHIVNSGHALFEAYLAAYNAHEDLVLSPDDIWLMITIYYASYVVDNAEQMRHLFVDHEGKKTLVVAMNTFEPDWPAFLNLMQKQIGTHVKNNVVDMLTSNFSTTGSVENLLSSVCIMHTFKKYFDYEHMVCGCGIRNVHFMGTIDDWNLLRKKVEELKGFTILPSKYDSPKRDFRVYLDGVLPILDQFIQTYKGNVDNNFWDGIFDYTKIGVSYGPSGIYMKQVNAIRGWFLRLCFGCHSLDANSKAVPLEDIGLNAISVPVKLIDLPKGGKETSCYVVGGFHGIHSSKDGKHRPVMSLAVFEKVEKVEKQSVLESSTSSEDAWY